MVVDFHTHILPGIDDGSKTVEESIALLRMEAEQGITHVVATPHFYARYDDPGHFLEKRDRAEQLLRQEMEKYPGLPKLTVGAEVYFFRGMSECEYLPRLTIGTESCILIEMPQSHWTEEMYRELVEIWEKQRLLPIVAHIDRYLEDFRSRKILRQLAELPVFVQANGDFFLERSTAALAMRMLKADQIQLLGSDCHNTNDRKPNLGEAVRRIEKKLGSDVLEAVRGYESKVLGL